MDTRILIVDDTPEDRLLAGSIVEKHLGWKPAYAANGLEAIAAIEKAPIDAVLTDLQMPEMNGLQLVDGIRTRFPHVPVILMTAFGSEELANQALQHGAASYVPKKNLELDLPEILERVVALARAEYSQQRLLDHLTEVELRFIMGSDPTLIPALVGHLQEYHLRLKLCDAAGKIRIGVALEEALLNAHYHGNLEVSSELREEGDEPFYRLAEERRRMPPYRDRKIHVLAKLSGSEARYVITDDGPGFNPSRLPDPSDPENIARSSGRGVLLIRTFMDEVRYNDKGNEITMIKRRVSFSQSSVASLRGE